jgi:hypothetical protein
MRERVQGGKGKEGSGGRRGSRNGGWGRHDVTPGSPSFTGSSRSGTTARPDLTCCRRWLRGDVEETSRLAPGTGPVLPDECRTHA